MPVHTNALKALKSKIANAPVLGVFNSSKPVVIQSDSSKDGLGCCMLQGGKPVAFASRSLTDTEKGYAQIEKEFLSIVFAATKFHYFIYGRQVEVLTDHKPLVSVMNKSVGSVVSPRLQRMKIKLLKYQLNLKYLPGKYMYVADLLSRSFIVKPMKDDVEMTEMVHSLTKHLQISEFRKSEFREATLSDVGLAHVLKFFDEGWPTNSKNIPTEAQEYFKYRDNIYIEEGLVFLNDRVIVPISLRAEMLKLLHGAHCGMEKAKARARQVLFWPGITKDIEDMVSRCKICERYRPRNIKEPLIHHEIPNLPYEKIGIDICEHGGYSFLVIGCYLSKWLDIIKLFNKTADEIIPKLKAVFSNHGIPKEIVCDNMPFDSSKFNEFSRKWGIELTHSSPRYPKSNGFAEKMVGIAKGILRKSGTETDKINEALLEHRNTPISGMNVSPAQILMSRCLRTKLPATVSILQPKIIQFQDTLKIKRDKSKFYYDRQTRERPDFSEGESVLLRVNNIWEPAKIVKKCKNPRSYLIKTVRGNILRRNSFHLRKRKNSFQDFYDNIDTPEITDIQRERGNIVHPNDLQNQSTENSNSGYVTRRGRLVRQPYRFRDYVV